MLVPPRDQRAQGPQPPEHRQVRPRRLTRSLIDVINTGRHLHLVFEYCDFDLQQFIAGQTALIAPAVVRHILRQLLEALCYCHSHRLLHRDIKPGNVLLTGNLRVKLGDFGLARSFRVPARRFTPEVVTLWYRSPELLLGSPLYSAAVDIWSVGAIFGEMITNQTMFRGVSETDQLMTIFATLGAPTEQTWPGSSRLALPRAARGAPINLAARYRRIGPEGVDLLRLMLLYDDAARITAVEALFHPFFLV